MHDAIQIAEDPESIVAALDLADAEQERVLLEALKLGMSLDEAEEEATAKQIREDAELTDLLNKSEEGGHALDLRRLQKLQAMDAVVAAKVSTSPSWPLTGAASLPSERVTSVRGRPVRCASGRSRLASINSRPARPTPPAVACTKISSPALRRARLYAEWTVLHTVGSVHEPSNVRVDGCSPNSRTSVRARLASGACAIP